MAFDGAYAGIDDGEPVIDLGEILAVPEGAVVRSRMRPGRRHALALAALAAFLVAVVSASATMPPGPLVIVARVPFSGVANLTVEGRHAIIVDNANGTNQITSYALPGGGQEWTESIRGLAVNSDLVATPTTVIGTFPNPRIAGSIVVAYDIRTGHLRWQRAGLSVELVPGGMLLFAQANGGVVLSMVDPDSGAVAWTITPPIGCGWQPARDAMGNLTDLLLEICSNVGRISLIDARTGQVQAVQTISASVDPGDADGPSPEADLIEAGPVSLVASISGGAYVISAYRTSDLSPIWLGVPLDVTAMLEACGPDLCFFSVGNGNELIVDPLTGQRLASVRPAIPTPVTPTSVLLVPDAHSYASIAAGVLPANDTPVAPGTSVQIAGTATATLWIDVPSRSLGRALTKLRGVEPESCFSIAGYIACPTGPGELTFWQPR